MVQENGNITSLTIKCRFGEDIRKWTVHHNNDLTLFDLLMAIQRIFDINADKFIVKYKDHEGDYITIVDDNDLLYALNTLNSNILTISVAPNTVSRNALQNIQEQINHIQSSVSELLHSISSLDELERLALVEKTQHKELDQHSIKEKLNYIQSPPSPIPSEKPEIPATIQPSVQEQVLNDGLHAPPIEEEIPLENSYAPSHIQPSVESLNSSFSAPPSHFEQVSPQDNQHQQFAPLPPSIPSFPQSNSGPPPQLPPIEPQQHQYAPPSHSSIASTPAPDQQHFHQQQFGAPPPQHQEQQFSPPQQQQPPFGGPPLSGPPQGGPPQGFAPQGGPPQGGPPQGFAPQGGPPQGGPPQGFAPPTQQQPGQFAPPPFQPPQGGQPQQFAPPPPQFGAPPTGFAPPPQQQFAPPPQGVPGSFAPQAQGGFAPPPTGAQSFGPPPTGAFGGVPGGPPGGNPFARGPANFNDLYGSKVCCSFLNKLCPKPN
ncbi:unnamed protein product [Caenorhabditis angaria]|uniref:PB1 domain-containing protein n=1 Tax=Caenorhabditis angaria TaxID=860376 RepID=A0A9P1I511_9PELO|nr:unnamed protein product [Caenorhabditis angaria]